ncbi:SCP2 sterol-binding domain-containing protein [Bradyrhizobium sp. HKCCYLRH2015]|uniref:SCP2 sterol-binding domain-containing protein n=1 Tax=unclassified Bradyrhizobium TaxID=2631580 RepID=UPI002916C301|nr:SCP2 sterol-binding domain-containing protein [Bradyrhizobium sp. SZCCHNR1015]
MMTDTPSPVAVPSPPPSRLSASELLDLARTCGADDCGLASIDDPSLAEDRPHILAAFPKTRTLLVLVGRMHREPVRSPARSVANLEFHRSGDHIDEVARGIVRVLEDRGIRALNPAMAFPMEMDRFPERGWIVSHKRAAEAAGLGRMGIHRSVIHPRFGSFILLGTVLIAAEVDAVAAPLDHNPCLECKLCVAACPVGAIKPDGAFDFSACLTHNYQQFMGGFVNFVEDIAESRSANDLRSRVSYAETVTRWQSLSYGPNYNAAYCLAVCPAGHDVIGPYLADRKQHVADVLEPLTRRTEPVYVVPGSDAADYVARRFQHKTIRFVRASVRATSIRGFLDGMRLTFQPGKSKGLTAIYHFTFTGQETAEATVTIRDRRLTVQPGHVGKADLRITADAKAWLRFLAKEISVARLVLTRSLRLKGPVRLMAAFGKCFPS